MSLTKLLTDIQQGNAINFDSLLKALPSNLSWQSIFKPTNLVAKNKYRVTIVDKEQFEILLKQSQAPKTRSEAASHSIVSSHYVSCDSAYMLCFPVQSMFNLTASATKVQGHSSGRHLLSVASVKKQPLAMLFAPAKNAILIENQDCFFEWQQFMAHFEISVKTGECDIFYAGGKRILNSAFAPFLSQYEQLYCAFDYDLEGLRIANSLMAKNYAKTQVLMPDELQSLTKLFTFKPQKLEKLLESLRLCEKMKLSQLHDIIAASKHFMEQEALLTLAKAS